MATQPKSNEPATDQQVSVSRVIDASAAQIFGVVSDASLHHVIDGSGTVQGSRGKPEQLRLGSKFSMSMKMGLPYVIGSEVVEFEQDRLIAWAHIGKHRWRYEIEVLSDDPDHPQCRVTETFDWSTSRLPKAIELMGYPKKHLPNMERTLERLEAFMTNRRSAP